MSDDISMTSSFLFIFLYFLFYFSNFDLGLQIKLNKFVKIPNSQNRNLGTIFGQNEITKIPFLSKFALYGYLGNFPN